VATPHLLPHGCCVRLLLPPSSSERSNCATTAIPHIRSMALPLISM
jgi:hypothetical protein